VIKGNELRRIRAENTGSKRITEKSAYGEKRNNGQYPRSIIVVNKRGGGGGGKMYT
jgi:hypothetical protein